MTLSLRPNPPVQPFSRKLWTWLPFRKRPPQHLHWHSANIWHSSNQALLLVAYPSIRKQQKSSRAARTEYALATVSTSFSVVHVRLLSYSHVSGLRRYLRQS